MASFPLKTYIFPYPGTPVHSTPNLEKFPLQYIAEILHA